jgi:3'(2'), 5'-bisphosphate nucleotidase
MMNPSVILEKLIPLVDEAGAAIMRIYVAPNIDVEVKDDQSPLTQADLQANAILVTGLQKHWPEIPILSEEGGNPFKEDDEPELYWAVDPLDGTKEFIKRNGEFTVNVALIHKGNPVLGVVLAPALDQLYVGYSNENNTFEPDTPIRNAQKRVGAHWDDIAVSQFDITNKDELSKRPIRIASSRSHPSEELAEWLKQFPNYEAIEVGSSLKFCLVAEGKIDVYPRFGPTCIWDTAAGHAVLKGAGGEVLQVEQGKIMLYHRPQNILNSFFIAFNKSYSRL